MARTSVAALALLVGAALLSGCARDAAPRAGERVVQVPHEQTEPEVHLANLIGGRLVVGSAGGRTCVWLGALDGGAGSGGSTARDSGTGVVWPPGVVVLASGQGVRVVQKGRTVVRPGEVATFSGGLRPASDTDDPCLRGRDQLWVDSVS